MRERNGNVAALVVGLGMFFLLPGRHPSFGVFLLCLGFVYAAWLLLYLESEDAPEAPHEPIAGPWWRFW